MRELSRSQAVGALLVGVVVVALGAWWVRAGDRGAAPRPVPVEVRGGAGAPGGRVVVHVAGAVRRPGVYRLAAGTRVGAAVRRAGGATGRADLDALNLAARVEDGRQVLVPRRAPAPAVGGAAVADPAPAGGGAGAPAVPAAPVNLNTATLEQLDTLPGIGPATAQAILTHRQEVGGFGSVEELDDVPGIGPATLEAIREAVTV